MFPFTLKYSIDITTDADEKVLRKTEEWLRINKINYFYKCSNEIMFKIGFFGWSWDKFGIFDSGRFIAENSRLTFVASMYRMFIFLTIACSILAFKAGWTIGLLFFIFIFFTNFFIARYQAKKALTELTSK